MSAKFQCLVSGCLCQPRSPPPSCQTCLYLTRQRKDGICHLCNLLRNLMWRTVSDEAASTRLPSTVSAPRDVIGSPVRRCDGLRSQTRQIRGESGSVSHDNNYHHPYRIGIISVETWPAFRRDHINGPSYLLAPHVQIIFFKILQFINLID